MTNLFQTGKQAKAGDGAGGGPASKELVPQTRGSRNPHGNAGLGGMQLSVLGRQVEGHQVQGHLQPHTKVIHRTTVLKILKRKKDEGGEDEKIKR